MTITAPRVSSRVSAGLIDFIESLTGLSLTRDPPSLSRCFRCGSQSLTSLSPKGEWRARDSRSHRLPLGEVER